MPIKAHSYDIAVPAALVLVIGCMILPLPAFLIDLLLIANLLFALLLVIGALQIKDPLKVAALPAVLLMAVLFRLSLNVATTRAVLSSGHAGQMVEAFGTVVTQGSTVVGFILFLLITLVQFIVVAKGAERVAEVSARFTLDALPGKQMAVDAELRSGGYDADTARRKRNEIQIESRFYGALDGAMKFVKGDAIAGLVVTLVNICGGLVIGLLVFNLDFSVAVRKYTVLTIGDGLLSQIPALLNSVAAGLIVTRVQVSEHTSLASDLLQQISQFTVARLFVAGAALLLGCLPGMPHLALFAIAAVVFASLLLKRPHGTEQEESQQVPFTPQLSEVLHIELSPTIVAALPDVSVIASELDSLREYAFAKWGLVISRPGVSLSKESNEEYRILVRGMDIGQRPLQKKGVELSWDSLQNDLKSTIDSFRVELLDDGMTRKALDYVEQHSLDLVTGVVPNPISLTQLTALLKGLLREGVTIKHMDVILQSLAEWGGKIHDRYLLAEVRAALRWVVSKPYINSAKISCLIFDPIVDLAFAKAEEVSSLVSPDLIEAISVTIEAHKGENFVVLTSKRGRGYVRDVIAAKGIIVPVLAYEEIPHSVGLNIIERWEMDGDQSRLDLLDSIAEAPSKNFSDAMQ